MLLLLLLLPLLLFLSAYAQTITTTVPNGPTLIEVVTTNLGGPTTQTLSTLTSSSSSTTTTTEQGPGPVGQPAATTGTPGGPTPYTYTTVVNGITTAIADTFTPTSPATLPISIGASGTVLDYSSWLSIYGPPKSASSNAAAALSPKSALILTLAALLCWIIVEI